MACPSKANKQKNKLKKKYKRTNNCLTNYYEDVPDARPGFMVKVAPIVIRCLGGGIKQLEEDIRDFLNEKERFTIAGKMQWNVLWESKFIVRRVMSGLINWMFSIKLPKPISCYLFLEFQYCSIFRCTTNKLNQEEEHWLTILALDV